MIAMRKEEEALLSLQNNRTKREHYIDKLKYLPTKVDFNSVRSEKSQNNPYVRNGPTSRTSFDNQMPEHRLDVKGTEVDLGTEQSRRSPTNNSRNDSFGGEQFRERRTKSTVNIDEQTLPVIPEKKSVTNLIRQYGNQNNKLTKSTARGSLRHQGDVGINGKIKNLIKGSPYSYAVSQQNLKTGGAVVY